MKNLLLIPLVSLLFLFTGCNTTSPNLDPALVGALPYIEGGANLAACMVLDYAVSDSDREVKAKCLYGIAAGVRTLMDGSLPSPESLKETLQSFAISDGLQWVNLSSSLTKIYEKEIDKIKGDPKAVMAVLEAIAEGVESAAKTYIPQ